MAKQTPHELRYAHEKFSRAVYEMAIGPESIKERLHDGYMQAMRVHPPEHLPEELTARLEELHHRMTHVEPVGDEGRLNATIDQMSEDDAVQAAKEIYEIASLIEDLIREAE